MAYLILLWYFLGCAYANVPEPLINNPQASVIFCDSLMRHCFAIKSLSKLVGDRGEYSDSNNAVYLTNDSGKTWKLVSILKPLPKEAMDGPISIGNMKMHCNNYGTCLIVGIVELNTGFRDIVTYVTNDSGLHWNGPEFLHITETKVINIIDLSCNQVGDQCQILIKNGWFEPPVIYKTEDLGKTWIIYPHYTASSFSHILEKN